MPAFQRAFIFLLTSGLCVTVAREVRAQPSDPSWVKRSDALAQVLVAAQAELDPETFSFSGFTRYDDQVIDLRPDREVRLRAANEAAKAKLEEALRTERDPDVRDDLEIMIDAAARAVADSALNERYRLEWFDVAEHVFGSLSELLSDQIPAERRAQALPRLLRYVGLAPNTLPTATLARQLYERRAGIPGLLHVPRRKLERAVAISESLVSGTRELFDKYKIAGSDAALHALEEQVRAYSAWTREVVLPTAREDTRLPPELYAHMLRTVGIDVSPRILLQRAQLEFAETRSTMQLLAARVAEQKHLPSRDYRDVIRALKRKTIPKQRLEQSYRRVIDSIDAIIVRERIAELPKRPLVMRLATDAENAYAIAPYLHVPPLWENRGEQAQFVLTTSNPSPDGKADVYDDFNYEAVAWTLSAHEARPGHELQNSAMIERGVSFARKEFAFNSVNVEGWALYAEAELIPYEPPEAQLIALQFRLMRAARAMLDPMLNLGLVERDRAERVLLDDVVLSPAMARQELDRYTFEWPGQAGAYFFGYDRLTQLRMEVELALGAKFDRFAYNNFVLSLGMVPLRLVAKAVRERFVPAQLAKPVSPLTVTP